MEKVTAKEESTQLVNGFLRRVSKAAATLSRGNASDVSLEDALTSTEGVDFVDAIAQSLLRACEPTILLQSTDDLPAIGVDDEDPVVLDGDDEGDDDDDEDARRQTQWNYEFRRTDYLRLLLRFMAPVSMHVASKICHDTLVSGVKGLDPCTSAKVQAAFLLFSHWLPVAPHLTPMVVDFLRQLEKPWKDLDFRNQSRVFLFVEASYKLCTFFLGRGQIMTIQRLWDWTFLFDVLQNSDVEMMGDHEGNPGHLSRFIPKALQWYAARALTCLLDWKPQVALSVLERLEIADENVPWEPHIWTLEGEEKDAQIAQFRRKASLWGLEESPVPFSAEIVHSLPTPPYLAHVGNGILFYKRGALRTESNNNINNKKKSMDINADTSVKSMSVDPSSEKCLIPTATTCKNIALLGAALCQEPHPPPIMLCGPQGAGKSAILREMLRLCRPGDSLLEFHIDEETDSKTLIGSYSTTDIPGEFAWRPGALTHASREGKWVLFEDIDTVPIEIQATIVMLLEERVLPLGNGKYEKSHPDFRIFATCSTQKSDTETRSSQRFRGRRGAGRRILNPSLWRKVHVQPLPFLELREVAVALYPQIPASVIDVALAIMKSLDTSRRSTITATINDSPNISEIGSQMDTTVSSLYTGGRSPSVRDFFKLLSRVSHGICFELNVTYATEYQRMICLTESVEILVGSCPDLESKQDFVARVAAPAWGISGDLARSYVFSRCPSTRIGADFVEIGRARIPFGRHTDFARKQSETFAQTNHALRLMEEIGVCVRQNEPCLLIGETGCGKTTMVQQLAALCEKEIVVQNLSLQTDSTDLLGGFKPLEIKNVARRVYLDFVDLFVSTFSRKQNAKFLQFASSMLEKGNWKKLSQCFQRSAELGILKMKERKEGDDDSSTSKNHSLALHWDRFKESATKFERQILSCDAGLAFVFSEGALVDAIKNGKWVLLDEINLASSDTLQRLCGLLDDPHGSVTLTERGDASEIPRHPSFRLFAAMNPATDAGKKDLPASIRTRFSEIFVNELLDPVELRVVAARYLENVLPVDGKPPEHKDIVINVVDVYLKCRQMADTQLSDGTGHKPRYTLRTLTRALSAAKAMVVDQRLPLKRSLYEGFQLSFEGALDEASVKVTRKVLKALLPEDFKKTDLEQPGRRPNGKDGSDFVLVKPFWIKTGPQEKQDWSLASSTGKSRFVLTPSISSSLRRLSRALASGPWPILLEGPTSAGKTSLVEYIAARCGHHVVRINNHEHTDVQEYTGSFAADQNGSLSFQDGLLVRALRRGHWVILDELNLAPSEVLEALNRLLDDNRELYLAETNETVKPHANFRLFATQNPSGAYGGRKPLSRAFRNRFVEVHMGDIPSEEMRTILEKKCGCPPSAASRLVDVMVALRNQRSKSNIFLGKDSFITPRDLLRWAERNSSSRLDFAEQGYMLLAERLRTEEEKAVVQSVLEEHLKVKLNPSEMYYGDDSMARKILQNALQNTDMSDDPMFASIAPTRSLLRLICLVTTCIEQKEPVLLVGETGCGKTTVVQFLSRVYQKSLYAVNCHATTETSDLLGGLRPIRRRENIQQEVFNKLRLLLGRLPDRTLLEKLDVPETLLPDKFDGLDSPTLDDEEVPSSVPKTKLIPEVETMLSIARAVMTTQQLISNEGEDSNNQSRTTKRRKINAFGSSSDEETANADANEKLLGLKEEIEVLARQYSSLFEWRDGPLVTAMKSGQMLLLDEMSLAEDAVLERLNSVLEPCRTLVLAEKGDDGSSEENRVVVAHEGFRVFATMNPGGDFGKRELSPALRSRFTEIWVPPVTERADFELALSRTLDPMKNSVSRALIDKMLDYVNWFNHTVCGDPSSPYAAYVLSLRDILSWARFIDEAQHNNANLTSWDAYIHGAALMHLDGLGLGAGLALEDSNSFRVKAESYLMAQLPDGITTTCLTHNQSFVVKDSASFGASPFFIPLGTLDLPQSEFNMAAPTTATNTFRVLRAMQIRKPILLEGSPGVGKTSLVTALAAASGNKLVRINLSEQTDISDLMGSDLPVQDSSRGGASFEWSDGVLLRAIKEGSWVLLDELNLASQSVLEGLNSCLDHRGTVYIPELGKTFHCLPTFRVFGAQNPLAQGGGRKGLPKSFLNRFTKVYVDALNDTDLSTIVRSRYPSLDDEQVDCMIDFNKSVHTEVVEKREYGSEGTPWEFNLRDLFRWCQLLEAQPSSCSTCARDIYLQRFRSQNDRERVDLSFKNYFASSMVSNCPPSFRVLEHTVQIGDTTLSRVNPLQSEAKKPLHAEPQLFLTHLLPMEAIARCVALKWPCLVIGQPSSGKTSAVRALAELCNIKLVEQCLSPSSDVTELLGCFEQVEGNDFEVAVARKVCNLIDAHFCLEALSSEASKQLWDASARFQRYINEGSGFEDSSSLLSSAFQICALLKSIAADNFRCINSGHFVELLQVLSLELERRIGQPDGADVSHFFWRDGVLVEAMINGSWLVLNNVNLCPSSVLDRLNSVMEYGGELLLSECGTVDEQGSLSHRVVKPHPNFRIFLMMDPANGEVSRAMRNRCTELYIPQPLAIDPNGETSDLTVRHETLVDLMGILHFSGARSADLGYAIIGSHLKELKASLDCGEETYCPRGLASSTSMVSSMLLRGISGERALVDLLQVGYELEEHRALQRADVYGFPSVCQRWNGTLVSGSSVRQIWSKTPPSAHVHWEARVLRLFEKQPSHVAQRIETRTLLSVAHCNTILAGQFINLDRWADEDDEEFDGLSSAFAKNFFLKPTSQDLNMRCSFLDGYRGDFASCFRWMARVVQKDVENFKARSSAQASGQSSAPASNHTSNLKDYLGHKTLSLSRGELDKTYFELKWLKEVSDRDELPDLRAQMTVLEASYLASQSILDRSTLSCPITPVIYTIFFEIDNFLSRLYVESTRLDPVEDERLCRRVRAFLGERDRFWNLLKETPLLLHPSSFLGFEETEFLVQWKWLKRALASLDLGSFEDINHTLSSQTKKLDSVIEIVDSAVHGKTGDSWLSWAVTKKMMRPRVPRAASHWKALFDVHHLAKECSLISHSCFSPFEVFQGAIDTASLVGEHHPLLFVAKDFRSQLLGAMATIHSYWTDLVPTTETNFNASFERIGLGKSLRGIMEGKRREFALQLDQSKVDTYISTVENQFTAEKLNEFKGSSLSTLQSADAYAKLARELLSAFSQIQLSPLREYQCVIEEREIIGGICRIMIICRNEIEIRRELNNRLPQLKTFINQCLSCVVWSVSDFRPYQTLVWVIEDGNVDHFSRLLRSLLPDMVASLSSHLWANSFNRVGVVAPQLELPNMWLDDEQSGERLNGIRGVDVTDVVFGHVRMQQQVRTEILLLIVGGQFALKRQPRSTRFYTIENFEHRLAQYKAMHKVLSHGCATSSKSDFWILLCMTCDAIKALREGLDWKDLDDLLTLLAEPSLLAETDLVHIGNIAETTTNKMLRETFYSLIFPLLGYFQDAWKLDPTSKQYIKSMALISTYLGLLRLKITSPHSPLDPGRAPSAKVFLINKRIKNLRAEVTARRLFNGFACGDFTPSTADIQAMLAEGDHLVSKRLSQERKVVKRPAGATPFHELYRLSRDFVERVASTSSVLELVGLISSKEDPAMVARRVDNWLMTSSSFCQRIDTQFEGYDDVTVTMKHSIRMIQDGLQSLAKYVNRDGTLEIVQLLFRKLLQYPMPNCDRIISLAIDVLPVIAQAKRSATEKKDIQFAIFSVTLSRLLLRRMMLGLSQNDLQSFLAVVDEFSSSHHIAVNKRVTAKSLDDIHQEKFREQFPDYRTEFTDLFEANDDEIFHKEETPEASEDMDGHDELTFSESQLEWLCLLVHNLFQAETGSILDSTRYLAFHYSYNAALALEQSFKCTRLSQSHVELMSGHCFAMMLSTPNKSSHSRVLSYLYKEAGTVDFHNEPNPTEVKAAKAPLERLMARSTQLLTAFPGHSVLLGIGRVCDKVAKFDIMTTPIGKVMTGMEVILRQAQDWEQHASDRVRLGSPLQEVGKLVASWRKLELESWPQLVLARRFRYQRKARRHLIRLQSILRTSSRKMGIKGTPRATHGAPHVPIWVWKGSLAVGQSLAQPLECAGDDDLVATTKILDTFILTSSLGEYQERLEILKTCAVQQEFEYRLSTASSSWTLQQARALRSVHAYYSQFEAFLAAKLDGMIEPLQVKLKDVVKLAKWDDQTYYALAESTEKNHRKLMTILSELDDCLDLNVGQIIQEEKVRGIRNTVDSTGDVSTSVPSDSVMFPHAPKREEISSSIENLNNFTTNVLNRSWVDAEKVAMSSCCHNLKIEKYAKKMKHILKSGKKDERNWAQVGVAESSFLCEAIFDRLSSLRTKANRPMKERALTDLFRELKRNGFTTTRWAVPDQVRNMEELFQLPTPCIDVSATKANFVSEFRRFEKYYQRSLAELNEYRSENLLLGSKHLSKRETDIMLCLGESGMLMIAQQRCLLSSILNEIYVLDDTVSKLSLSERKLPLGQSRTCARIAKFEKSSTMAVESLRQLALFVKASHELYTEKSQIEWARDTAAKIDRCVENMTALDSLSIDSSTILTTERVLNVEKQAGKINNARQILLECKKSCVTMACLPVDCFDAVLHELAEVGAAEPNSKPDRMPERGDSDLFIQSLSSAIERSLISFQSLVKVLPAKEGGIDSPSIWLCHRELINIWGYTDLKRLNISLAEVVQELKRAHEVDGDLSGSDRENLVGLASDVGVLAKYVQAQAQSLLGATASFYAHTSKLTYILLRIFRVLLSKGFCSDETAEDDGNNSRGDAEGMNFEDDQDGTGMGEGDGKRDVTDQLESEEQLSGLKNEVDQCDKGENRESRQLNEDEVDQGMEMEADFDGEMCDVPEKPAEEEEEDAEREELDREMGDEGSPDEQVLDERLWNDSDDEDDINKEEEKFEKDSGVQGEAIEGATRTKDDDDDGGKKKSEENEDQKDPLPNQPQEDNTKEAAEQRETDINEDNDDRYEDQHGVDVKSDGGDEEEDPNADDQMQLDDDLNLDAGNPNCAIEEEDCEEGSQLDQPEQESIEDALETAPEPELNGEAEEAEEAEEAATPPGLANIMEAEDGAETDQDGLKEETSVNIQGQQYPEQETHGIRSNDGADQILEDSEENDEEPNRDDAERGGGTSGSHGGAQTQSESNGNGSSSERDGEVEEARESQQEESQEEIPNPFKNPGDASKFWHKKLNIVDTNEENDESIEDTQEQTEIPSRNDTETKGEFQYTSKDEECRSQVLGKATEEEAVKMKQPEDDEVTNQEVIDKIDENEKKPSDETEKPSSSKQKRQPAGPKQHSELPEEQDSDSDHSPSNIIDDEMEDNDEISKDSEETRQIDEEAVGNRVVSDLSLLKVKGADILLDLGGKMIEDEQITGISSSEAAEARSRWLQIQGETFGLARRLCEKLRLVMEPLVASKLRGDYRTGKRINMKRVIGYIASGYRKDKIWLRRTKPAKRDYRVLLAVDDSESMQKSGAGEMALRALSTLAVGMNQLEIGELGIASFGEDMKLLHPFHLPFTTESGADIVMNFKFDQKRTRTSLCVESAIAALDGMGRHSSMQLVFLVSDGRIERDSRDKLKGLIREMMERNILLAMIIVEGEHKKKDSIVNMKEVTFKQGKPVVKRFIDDYPFPYYIILDDMRALPEVLGDALRQWFEMLTHLQSPP